ncbi:isochorismate synthase [Corynebacterium aquilae]|uniref:isochorismate synthase n=1 Tax=Corynebacterium aquilae TaxID=203263 RepID=UPI0009518240|nr:chorismate-binding protein [Corynebacterium aquilae]
MPASFSFSTAHHLLEAHGLKRKISPSNWDAARLNELCGNDMVVGALPFSNAAPARLFVPRQYRREARTNSGVSHDNAVACASQAPQQRGAAALDGFGERGCYRSTVARGLAEIERGSCEKVVLSRQIVGCMSRPVPVRALREELWGVNDHAFGYHLMLAAPWLLGRAGVQAPARPLASALEVSAVADGLVGAPHDVAHLLGASPELVLKVSGRKVTTFPLAGSVPRSADPVEDARRAEQLASSAKNLNEHAHVTNDIARVLRRFCVDVDIPEGPEVVGTPVIWHLGTKMSGTLRQGVSSWDVLCALHPTPAVSGWPQAAARRLIRQLEPTPRGVFAGVVGWCDAGGDCEWAMTLRGGIVHERMAYAFAGAGIVAGSTPEEEFRETTTKLSTFVAPLLRVMGSPHSQLTKSLISA